MNRILKSLINRLRDISRLYMFWKTDFLWLYKNRHLRMDANEPIKDKCRRLFHIDRYKFAIKCLKDLNRDDLVILDAACGTGYGSDILKRLNPRHIIGVDIDPKTIMYANKRYGSKKCIFKISDITGMKEFKDEMFDAVVSFETIEHIEQPIIFLENVNRLLKKKGILIISTPNKWGLSECHKFDYDYNLLKNHLERFFDIGAIYVQNSGCVEWPTNRGAPRRLVRADSKNIEDAECLIAVCKKGFLIPSPRCPDVRDQKKEIRIQNKGLIYNKNKGL